MMGLPIWVWLLAAMAGVAETQFREHVIAQDLRGGYHVVAADVNRDGRIDIIGLASGVSELAWFENPGWQRHVIAKDLTASINVAFYDLGKQATPIMVLATGFSMEPAKSAGIIHVLRPGKDAREPWEIREIDRLPTSHRLRFADLDGSGWKVAVNSPLAGAGSASPEYREKVPLVFYRPGEWKRETIADDFDGVLHGIAVVDWDGDGRDEILTAGFEGIHLLKLGRDGKWGRTRIAAGNPNPRPKGGSSDVAVGRLGKTRFLCAIEPWHGNEVVVYREGDGRWERTVIDDSLGGGHALVAADMNGDGRDEIVAGYRGRDGKTYIYSAADSAGTKWTRRTLDEGMPAASCTTADLNGDGKLDLACIGGASLKWYENLGGVQ